jgi:replicative DNA helicase
VVSRPPSRRIVEVVDAGRGETVCIEVAAADGLYVTDDFLVTHNSFGLLWIASQCWTKGDDTVLFTLENSVKMTVDRLVCMKLGIDYRRWQRGLCDQEEQDRVAWFINDHMPTMSAKFHVVMPEPGKRTMAAMVRHTQMLGVRRMFIDQLPFVEHPDPGRKPRNEIVRDMMHDCKSLISTGNEPVSAMIAHQISRDGMKRSSVANRLHMEDMAESSEVERTADWVFGLHQAEDDKKAGTALLEILAARREELNAWDMAWQPSYGVVAVTGRHVANPAPVATVVHS